MDSMAHVWITLPRLPVLFFAKPAFFKIATLLGTPLRLDAATFALKRPGVARIQVKIDLLQERDPQIWIGMGSAAGFSQKVEYENLHSYCTHCWHVGHGEDQCHVHNPTLKETSGSSPHKVVRQEYRPKLQPSVPEPILGLQTTVFASAPSSSEVVIVPASNSMLSEEIQVSQFSESTPKPPEQLPVSVLKFSEIAIIPIVLPDPIPKREAILRK